MRPGTTAFILDPAVFLPVKCVASSDAPMEIGTEDSSFQPLFFILWPGCWWHPDTPGRVAECTKTAQHYTSTGMSFLKEEELTCKPAKDDGEQLKSPNYLSVIQLRDIWEMGVGRKWLTGGDDQWSLIWSNFMSPLECKLMNWCNDLILWLQRDTYQTHVQAQAKSLLFH